MLKTGLDPQLMTGQSYDGAANMKGHLNGVNVLVRQVVLLALYIHCYAHQLNLAFQSACKPLKQVSDVIDMSNRLTTYIEDSPKRHHLFIEISSN